MSHVLSNPVFLLWSPGWSELLLILFILLLTFGSNKHEARRHHGHDLRLRALPPSGNQSLPPEHQRFTRCTYPVSST